MGKQSGAAAAVPTKRKAVSHKSILKRASTEEHGDEEDGEEEDEDDSLFALLLPSGTAVALVAADWRSHYSADPTAALAELYTLVARVRLSRVFPSACSVFSARL